MDDNKAHYGPYHTLGTGSYQPPMLTWLERSVARVVITGISAFVGLAAIAAVQFVDLRSQVTALSNPNAVLPGAVSKEVYLQYATSIERRVTLGEDERKAIRDLIDRQNDTLNKIAITVSLNAQNAEQIRKLLDSHPVK
jgi:hypothetical protein